uniref:ERVV2 protein n=1 Tax=Anser cygnoides TaxID=8845 RepID=A0A8B9E621_ANSCY
KNGLQPKIYMLTRPIFVSHLEITQNATVSALKTLQTEISSFLQLAIRNYWALDPLLASQGGVCMFINTACCFYADKSKRIECNDSRHKPTLGWGRLAASRRRDADPPRSETLFLTCLGPPLGSAFAGPFLRWL